MTDSMFRPHSSGEEEAVAKLAADLRRQVKKSAGIVTQWTG
jgi:hypothetical protein